MKWLTETQKLILLRVQQYILQTYCSTCRKQRPLPTVPVQGTAKGMWIYDAIIYYQPAVSARSPVTSSRHFSLTHLSVLLSVVPRLQVILSMSYVKGSRLLQYWSALDSTPTLLTIAEEKCFKKGDEGILEDQGDTRGTFSSW